MKGEEVSWGWFRLRLLLLQQRQSFLCRGKREGVDKGAQGKGVVVVVAGWVGGREIGHMLMSRAIESSRGLRKEGSGCCSVKGAAIRSTRMLSDDAQSG